MVEKIFFSRTRDLAASDLQELLVLLKRTGRCIFILESLELDMHPPMVCGSLKNPEESRKSRRVNGMYRQFKYLNAQILLVNIYNAERVKKISTL